MTKIGRPRAEYCQRGHSLAGDNRYIAPKTGSSGCRECRSLNYRQWYERTGGPAADESREKYQRYAFGGNREAVIVRDAEKCVKCGMTRNEHKAKYSRDITVDHIDGRGRNHSPDEKNNDLSNLQTLCIPCHASKDSKRGWEERKLQSNDKNN